MRRPDFVEQVRGDPVVGPQLAVINMDGAYPACTFSGALLCVRRPFGPSFLSKDSLSVLLKNYLIFLFYFAKGELCPLNKDRLCRCQRQLAAWPSASLKQNRKSGGLFWLYSQNSIRWEARSRFFLQAFFLQLFGGRPQAGHRGPLFLTA